MYKLSSIGLQQRKTAIKVTKTQNRTGLKHTKLGIPSTNNMQNICN